MDETTKQAVKEAAFEVVKELEANKQAQIESEAKSKQEFDAAVKAAVEAEMKKKEAEEAPARRLPSNGQAPYAAKFAETWKYDNLTPGETALMIDVLKQGGKDASEYAYKALALKMENDKGPDAAANQYALKSIGLKANELNHSTQSGYGSQWVGTAYSNELWRAIRDQAQLVNLVPSAEMPAGNSSIYYPLEGADPTFYKVAEATGNNATTLIPDGTVPASKVATANKQITLAKMGARTIYSGEMEEDSLIPFVSQLREQMVLTGAETMDAVLINGDTETGASTNINAIDTTPAGTEWYLLANGFRKSPLVTTIANSRSAGGSLDVTDFLETVKLMGSAGLNALDVTKTAFIVDLNTYWKAGTLPEVLTRDVFSGATIENGMLTRLFGYKIIPSAFMHWGSAKRMANTAGKIDADTDTNNTTGAILAVRFDQWKLVFRRRMTIEVQRIPQADATQIVALARWGLGQRDTEASAITYNVGV